MYTAVNHSQDVRVGPQSLSPWKELIYSSPVSNPTPREMLPCLGTKLQMLIQGLRLNNEHGPLPGGFHIQQALSDKLPGIPRK